MKGKKKENLIKKTPKEKKKKRGKSERGRGSEESGTDDVRGGEVLDVSVSLDDVLGSAISRDDGESVDPFLVAKLMGDKIHQLVHCCIPLDLHTTLVLIRQLYRHHQLVHRQLDFSSSPPHQS